MKQPHKDFLGQELNIGDQVVAMIPQYRSLRHCFIVDMTPQKVRVRPKATNRDINMTFLQTPDQVVKIDALLTVK